jgi:hypothetical protein
MKLKTLLISIALLSSTLPMMAEDNDNTIEVPELSTYDKHVQRMTSKWASLIPTHLVIQNAGNMGIVSAGIGWSYGKHHQWECDLMFGYIPIHDSNRGKLTSTIKGNYMPWNICLNPNGDWTKKGQWNFEPLSASLYINTVYGHEFWRSQPGRYPDKYYDFMSTKFRLNAAIGQRITYVIPKSKRQHHNRVTLFYEVGTCDLYIRSMFQTSISLKDILGLSIGAKFYML